MNSTMVDSLLELCSALTEVHQVVHQVVHELILVKLNFSVNTSIGWIHTIPGRYRTASMLSMLQSACNWSQLWMPTFHWKVSKWILEMIIPAPLSAMVPWYLSTKNGIAASRIIPKQGHCEHRTHRSWSLKPRLASVGFQAPDALVCTPRAIILVGFNKYWRQLLLQ